MPKWNSKIKGLLINWKQQITINEQQHLIRADRTKKVNMFLELVDTLGNASVLTILVSASAQNFISETLLYITTVINSFTFACSGILGWYSPGVLSQKHYSDAKEYNALVKLIDSTLAIEPDEDPKEFVTTVRRRFEEIADDAADIPYNDMVHSLELQIYNNPKDACGDRESSEDNDSMDEHKAGGDKDGGITRDDYFNYQWGRFENDVE